MIQLISQKVHSGMLCGTGLKWPGWSKLQLSQKAGHDLDGVGSVPSLEEGITAHSTIPAWRIPMDRGAGQATVHGVAQNQTQANRLGAKAHKSVSQEQQCEVSLDDELAMRRGRRTCHQG